MSLTMNIKIHYSCDEEEEFCTDDTVLRDTTWAKVLAEVESIEGHATVLEITRTDLDP